MGENNFCRLVYFAEDGVPYYMLFVWARGLEDLMSNGCRLWLYPHLKHDAISSKSVFWRFKT